MGEDIDDLIEEQPQGDFLSYLKTEDTNNWARMFEFALDTLTFANKCHIYHWSCEKGFHHTQFEEVYDELREFADSLVETTLAYADGKFVQPQKQYVFQGKDFNAEEAIQKIVEWRSAAENMAKFVEGNRSLTNLFDDAISGIDKHIGLLKNFG